MRVSLDRFLPENRIFVFSRSLSIERNRGGENIRISEVGEGWQRTERVDSGRELPKCADGQAFVFEIRWHVACILCTVHSFMSACFRDVESSSFRACPRERGGGVGSSFPSFPSIQVIFYAPVHADVEDCSPKRNPSFPLMTSVAQAAAPMFEMEVVAHILNLHAHLVVLMFRCLWQDCAFHSVKHQQL